MGNHRPQSAKGQAKVSARNGAANGHAGAATIPIAADHDACARTIVRLERGHDVHPEVVAELPASPIDWCGIAFHIKGMPDVAARCVQVDAWLKRLNHPPAAEALAKARLIPDDDLAEPEDQGPKPFSLGIVGSREFAAKKFTREWLVKGIMVLGQPCIIGGPKKGMKTSTMVDLVISIGTATPFLGEFEVPRPRRVLFLSGESGDATIQETMRRVCKAKGLDPDELEGQVFWGFTLPQLGHPEQVDALADFIRENGIEVVIIDPLYLCLTSSGTKVDPANLFDVGPLLKQVCDVCGEAGATPGIVHHLRKNRENPYGPPELEDLAFAGVQEFARQWIMIGRREEYEPGTGEHKLWLGSGGSAGHSGGWAVDVSEGVVDEDFGGRDWRVSIVRAADARASAREQEKQSKAERAMEQEKARDEARAKKLRDAAAAALGILRRLGSATKTQWKTHPDVNCNSEKIDSIIGLLVAEGRIRPARVEVPSGKGTKVEAGYEPTPDPDTRTNPDEPGRLPISSASPGMDHGDDRTRTDGRAFKGSRPSPGTESGSDADIRAPKKRRPGTHKSPGVDSPAEGVDQ